MGVVPLIFLSCAPDTSPSCQSPILLWGPCQPLSLSIHGVPGLSGPLWEQPQEHVSS